MTETKVFEKDGKYYAQNPGAEPVEIPDKNTYELMKAAAEEPDED